MNIIKIFENSIEFNIRSDVKLDPIICENIF
jgi:hypothetical protein